MIKAMCAPPLFGDPWGANEAERSQQTSISFCCTIELYMLVWLNIGIINSKINGTHKRYLVVYFEATLDFSRSEFACP